MNKYKYRMICFFCSFIISVLIAVFYIAQIYDNPIDIGFLSFLLSFFISYCGYKIGDLIDFFRNERNN